MDLAAKAAPASIMTYHARTSVHAPTTALINGQAVLAMRMASLVLQISVFASK